MSDYDSNTLKRWQATHDCGFWVLHFLTQPYPWDWIRRRFLYRFFIIVKWFFAWQRKPEKAYSTCSCPGSTLGCHTSSPCTLVRDGRQKVSRHPGIPVAELESGPVKSCGWYPEELSVLLHLWGHRRIMYRNMFLEQRFRCVFYIYTYSKTELVSNCLHKSLLDMNQKQVNKTMNMQIVQDMMVGTYLWPINWMNPVVWSCRKMSGMTSARLSTHSKQWVFKIPCNFGRRKNTWLTNLKIFKMKLVRKLPTGLDSLAVFIYEVIYIMGVMSQTLRNATNSPVHKWRKVLRYFV